MDLKQLLSASSLLPGYPHIRATQGFLWSKIPPPTLILFTPSKGIPTPTDPPLNHNPSTHLQRGGLSVLTVLGDVLGTRMCHPLCHMLHMYNLSCFSGHTMIDIVKTENILREGKALEHGHTINKWNKQGSNPHLSDVSSHVLTAKFSLCETISSNRI